MPSPSPGTGEKITFTTPQDNAIITQTPFQVSLNALGENIARVDLAIDGTIVKSFTKAPYTTSINQRLSTGSHTLSAKAVYSDETTSTASITIEIELEEKDETLQLTSPLGGNANFPIDPPQN